MKMEFKLLLTLLFAIFFVGCKSYEEVNNLKLYDFEDYIPYNKIQHQPIVHD